MIAYNKNHLLAALLVMVISAAVAQADAVIKKNHMTYNGLRYYKAKAQDLRLGDWGEKKTPATQANYLEQKGSVQGAIQKVTINRFKMSQNGSTQANVLGNFNIPALGWGLSGDDFYKKLKTADYEFLSISIRNKLQAFKKNVNKKTGAIKNMAQRNDHRIVSSIIVVVKGSEAKKMGLTHKGSFTGTWNGMKLTVDSDVKKESDRQFQPASGTVYAYMLDDIKWDATRKKKRTKIIDLSNDQHGPY